MKFRIRIILSVILTFIGASIIIWLVLRGYYIEKFINPHTLIDLDRASKIGDFIGGFTGALFTLTGVLLLYETLAFQRKELKESRQVFEKQQFDNSYFELIRLYNECVAHLFSNQSGKNYRGRGFLKFNKEQIQTSFTSKRVLSYNRKHAVNLIEKFYAENHDNLSVFFRTLYRIYSLIDHSNISEIDKANYSKILRAQLSDSELFFLRYNAMSEVGHQSAFYINKYNILKHLSHFDLLEYKDWWKLLDHAERNGIGYLFQELKSVLKNFIRDKDYSEIFRKFQNNKYVLKLSSEESNYFEVLLIIDRSKSSKTNSIIDGFDKFTDKQIESLLECLIKDIVILSNFNQFNNRRDIIFYSDTKSEQGKIEIKVGVKNKNGDPIIVAFPH